MTSTKPAASARAASKTPAAKRVATRNAATKQASAKKVAAPLAPTTKPKQKLVRDSFTIPKAEYAVLEGLKVRAANLKRPTKKSELLRAGVASLSAMSDKAFLSVLAAVPSLKTGRPKSAQDDTKATKGSATLE